MAFFPRATLVFQDGDFGWSETHYSTIATDLTGLTALALSLAQTRARALCKGQVLDWIRLSLDDVRRDSLIIGRLGLGTGFAIPPAPDMPYNLLLCRCTAGAAGTVYSKELYLGGIPDVGGKPLPPNLTQPFWSHFFHAYTQKLLNDGWGFKVLARHDQGCPNWAIDRVGRLLDSSWVEAPGNTLLVDDTAHVSCVKTAKGRPINGDHKVIDTAAGGWVRLEGIDPAFVPASRGRIRLRKLVAVPYSSVQATRLGTHSRKGVFRPVSWEHDDDRNFPLDPCGQIVDLMRTCYQTQMSFLTDKPDLVGVRWYFATRGAQNAPYTAFGSGIWHDQVSPWQGIGEVKGGKAQDKGVNKNRMQGICRVGSLQQFAEGLSTFESLFRLAKPPCCRPRPIADAGGGIGLGGFAPGIMGLEGGAHGGLASEGTATPIMDALGTASVALVLEGTTTSTAAMAGDASGGLALGGLALPTAAMAGDASGGLALGGFALPTAAMPVYASGTLALQGNAVPAAQATATADGALAVQGNATPVAQATATADGALAVQGNATPAAQATATASGKLSLQGNANPGSQRTATVNGALAVQGNATPTADVEATASGALVLAGSAVGTSGGGGGGGGPTLASSTTVANASGSVSVTKPSGTASGDYLLLATCDNSFFTPASAPAGFTRIVNFSNGFGENFQVWYKLAGGAEPSSYSVTTDSMGNASIVLARITGASAAPTAGTAATGGGTSAVASSISAAGSADLLIAVFGRFSAETFGTPTGMTAGPSASSSFAPMALFTQALSASGATGSRTSALTNGGTWAAVLVDVQ